MIWSNFWHIYGLEWNTALLTMPLTSGAGVSVPAFEPQEDIKNIHCDTLVKTFNLSLLNKTFFQIIASFLTSTFHKVA